MSNLIEIGLVGTGVVASEHVRDYHSQPGARTHIAGLVDANVEAAKAFAEKNGLDDTPVFGSVSELLAAKNVSVLEICTPPVTHGPLIDQATAAGVAALTEKPFTDSVESARAIAELASERGVAVGVMQNFRYRPEYVAARELIETGAVGTVNLASIEVLAHWYGGSPYRLAADRMIFMEIGLHYIDLLRSLVGADIETVYARLGSGTRSLARGETFGAVTLGFIGGATAQLLLTGEVPGSDSNWGGRALVQGDEGAIRLNDPSPRSLDLYSHIWGGKITRDFEESLYAFSTLNSFAAPLDDYYATWQKSGQFPVTASSNLNSLSAALACYESSDSASIIHL